MVIPNPLSFTSPVTAGLSAKRILSTGRLIATKGFDLLIESFRLVAMRHPDWKLTILGEGQDKQYLLNKIRLYKLEDRINILPPTSDILSELLNTSIYAAASRYEGFGLAITEAMECGVPCVAFDCECGPREIITHGEDGLLIEPFHIERFAEALLLLIEDPTLRTQLGRQANISAGRFAPVNIMQQWETLFNSLVTQNTTVYA
jgi:glycosyltransferase involved in cell wall biosynthesis